MAVYNKYKGNSGYMERVTEAPARRKTAPMAQSPRPPIKQPAVAKQETMPPSPLSGLSGELGRIFGKLSSLSLETEDLLLIAILYLMYRESGDQDFLIMIGAFLFL